MHIWHREVIAWHVFPCSKQPSCKVHQASQPVQDSRFWGPGSDSDDDSEEEEVTSSEEGSEVSDSDSDSSDDENAAGCVIAALSKML